MHNSGINNGLEDSGQNATAYHIEIVLKIDAMALVNWAGI